MRKILFHYMLVLSLSGCGAASSGSATISPAQAIPTAQAQQSTATQPMPTNTSSQLQGRICSASDVAGQPDTPLANQFILAIPAQQAAERLGMSGALPANDQLRFLKATIATAHPAVITTLSDAAGMFTLLVQPNDYLVCVADTQQPGTFPATTRGCGRVSVSGTTTRVDISSGFGEVLVVQK